jgi:energy-coupling factor transporter transmembrane protein EcfT
MLCRGYNADAQVYVSKKKLQVSDIVLLAGTFVIIAAVHLFNS